MHQRYRQTGQTNRQRSDSIRRTVLQTVAQKSMRDCYSQTVRGQSDIYPHCKYHCIGQYVQKMVCTTTRPTDKAYKTKRKQKFYFASRNARTCCVWQQTTVHRNAANGQHCSSFRGENRLSDTERSSCRTYVRLCHMSSCWCEKMEQQNENKF